ncbi:hypothetical protein JCM8202v2_003482 [Rhodotorula sphaerocarpa]
MPDLSEPEFLILDDASDDAVILDAEALAELSDGSEASIECFTLDSEADTDGGVLHFEAAPTLAAVRSLAGRTNGNGRPAARKSTRAAKVPAAKPKQRLRPGKIKTASRRTRPSGITIKQEEPPAPTWPTSPPKPSLRARAEALKDNSREETVEPFGLTFPFSLELRLEHARLSAGLAASRPQVEAAIAFRYLDQSTASASVAASSTVRLSPAAALGAKSTDGIVHLGPLDLPQPTPLDVRYRPEPSGDEGGAGGSAPDLRDVFLLLTFEPEHEQPTISLRESLLKDQHLVTAGARTRKLPDGSQIGFSWRVSERAPRLASLKPLVDEEDVKELIETELRAAEVEWRRKFSAEINAQPPPSFGPPTNLLLPTDAPSPATLIPGLAEDSLPDAGSQTAFGPVPAYRYTSLATRAIPFSGHALEVFPQLDGWEDAAATNAFVAERLSNFAAEKINASEDDAPDDGSTVQAGGGTVETEATLSEVATGQADPPEDWLRDALIDLNAFQAPDIGRTTRDYRVLMRLLERLEPEDDGGNLAPEDDERLLAALHLFRQRVGRSAEDVKAAYRLIAAPPKEEQDDFDERCQWCGAILCTLHSEYVAYNRPKNLPKRVPSDRDDVCERCGHEECVLARAMDRMQVEEEEAIPDDPVLRRLGKLDPCTLALITGNVPEKVSSPDPAEHPTPQAPSRRMANRDPYWQEYELRPFEAVRGASEAARTATAAQARDAGVSDAGASATRAAALARQNSRIRLGQYKATCTVRSRIPDGGYGLALLEPVTRGDLLGVYGGELLSQFAPETPEEATVGRVADAWRAFIAEKARVSYWFDIDNSDAVDSEQLGGITRFINHAPPSSVNVTARILNLAGTHQIGIFATKDLAAGEELFLNYGDNYKF